MSKGLPIISSNFGPMPEVLKDAGLYFDLTNINSFIDKLELMVFDPTIRLKLSEKAFNYSKEYSWSKCSIDTINFITKIKKILNKFKNKTLLITGGTGSFGNAVLRKFIKSNLKEVRIFSRDEKKNKMI